MALQTLGPSPGPAPRDPPSNQRGDPKIFNRGENVSLSDF